MERIKNMTEIRKAAALLYKAPFRYECGFIWDANNSMVVDNFAENAAARIRGWGAIQYLPQAEELQDEVGKLIAEILTEHWPKHD